MNEADHVSLFSFIRPDDFRMEEVKSRCYRNQYPKMLTVVAERCTTNTFDWKGVLHFSVGLRSLVLTSNFVVIDTEFCETKKNY